MEVSGNRKEIAIRKRMKLSLETTLLLMTLPFVIFMIAFNYIPLLGWSLAFIKYSPGVSILKSSFTGFTNFLNIFTYTSEFPQVMINTFAISFLGIITTPLPVILAILISEIRGPVYKKFIQTSTSLPNFMSWIIVYSIAFSFLSIDDGLVNELLMKLHLISHPTNILGNNNIVWYVQTLIRIWKTVGWSAIIYLGAISGIEQELYEAVKVDGGGKLKQIFHITIPGIMPTFVVLLFISVGYLLSGTSFEQIYVFHNALVHDKIQNLDYYVYIIGLKHLDFSLATAVGVFKTVVSVTLLFVSSLISKKIVGHSII